MLQDRNFQDHAEFYQDCFECARRWKVMNPDRLRSEYGKLVYMLMDSTDVQIQVGKGGRSGHLPHALCRLLALLSCSCTAAQQS